MTPRFFQIFVLLGRSFLLVLHVFTKHKALSSNPSTLAPKKMLSALACFLVL